MSDVEDNVEVIDNRQHFFCVGSTDCSEKIKERDDGNRLLETDLIAVAFLTWPYACNSFSHPEISLPDNLLLPGNSEARYAKCNPSFTVTRKLPTQRIEILPQLFAFEEKFVTTRFSLLSL